MSMSGARASGPPVTVSQVVAVEKFDRRIETRLGWDSGSKMEEEAECLVCV